MSESSTACPTCDADGVRACEGLDGADHPGRPPYFDAHMEQVLNLMARHAEATDAWIDAQRGENL